MFWRKQRAAIDRFHPLHQKLTWEHVLGASLPPAEWMALVASLSQHRYHVRRRKWQLPYRTQTTVVPLIRILAEDARPDSFIEVTADLRGPNVPGKAGPSAELPVQRPIRRCLQWFTVDPWLTVRAVLRDGSVLELTVNDRTRYRRITKRTPRGKIKTKTKTKLVRRIRATRTLGKKQALQQPPTPPPAWLGVRVRNEKRPVIRTTAKVIPTREETDQILAVVTELFRWTRSERRTA